MGVNHVWESAPFHVMPIAENLSFWNWLDILKRELDPDKLHLAIVVCWKLWERRNKIIHQEDFINLEDMVGWCAAYLRTYDDAQLQHNNVRRPEFSQTWTPPPIGVLKLNVDAAFPPNSEFHRVSLIARNATGTCVWWQVRRVLGMVSPSEGEAHAILQALRTAKFRQWNAITVESDCLLVIEALQKREPSLQSYGAIVEECFSYLSCFSFCTFSFVKRQGNSLAHYLASSPSLDSMEGISLPTILADSA
ncbi:PREDICTED: uncharacterized protein LOC105972189 [Erythranthe guttata]|uniref:uncharacterized protein LOC105972189 n=1 Tax=Erythranthe guttata TaxID=4155 RepID=UPI00064DF531|nr:PREDICTED: uncharacterized protein LOC105972189 [Erythranthe guttata]|eukprot:XP_012852581.1 PREDICTED: uncharacterized protein LOC105972189 [Erythranthe guttata]